ncbi:MAG: ArsR family transcriptional regulator [Chloroflexi bacterium]|nr:transcriptional regulator [Anaerolineaceae bacterium]NMB91012.1 ArsR family transcriptional regulator [Chloroflexota bacterium]
MVAVFEELAGLDRLIHEPARLSIMTALSAVQSADFTFLQQLTGLSVGNLSNHLAKLEQAGMVHIEKGFVNKRPNTMISITAGGKQSIEDHWQQLEALRKDSQAWKKSQPE